MGLSLFARLVAQQQSGAPRVERVTPYGRVVLFHEPAQVAAVLAESRLVRTELIKVALGEGLLAADGPWWRSQRRLLGRYFAAHDLPRFGEAVPQALSERLEGWDDAEVDLGREMTLLTLDVLLRAIFDLRLEEPADELAEAISDVVLELGRVAMTVFDQPLTMHADFSRRIQAAVARLDAFASRWLHHPSGLVAELRSHGLSDRQVRDEVVSMLISGHETTALSLTWAFQLLDAHPPERARLEREADEVLAGRVARREDLERLPYAHQVLQETMRLYPPVWFIARRVTEDLDIADCALARGTTAVVSPYLLHRHPSCWPDPERFLPDRSFPRQAYLPFGGGRHTCLGMRASLAEGVLCLATLAGRYRLRSLDPSPRPVPALTLRQDAPARVRLERRC